MHVPRLHAITDDARLADARFVHDAAAVLEAGGEDLALHLRGRLTTAARLYELATTLLPIARAHGAKLLVNDRVDVALVAKADGVQLREDSLDASRARAILGSDALIGVSRHERSMHAQPDADFVIFGSIYETRSHVGAAAAGIGALRAAASGVGRQASGTAVPLIAIGGITPARVAEIMKAGAYGVAALSGLWGQDRQAIAEYLNQLQLHADSDA